MEKYFINPDEYNVDKQLEGFEIANKPSNSIEYYGTNGTDIFIQFMHGVAYIYPSVDKKMVEELHKAENLGLYMSGLSRRYTYQKSARPLVSKKDN